MPLLGLALATAAAIIIPARRSTRLRRCLLAGAAGFAGMLAETIAILHYQVKSGVLFQDIGLLLMSFMAGLSLGAFACDRISSRSGRGLERGWGVIFLAGLALMGGALAFVTQTGYSADIWGSGILLGCTGVLVSGLFSYSAKSKAGEEQTAVPLYSADLIGGVFGCLAASLVLIPGAGMTAASLMVIPAAILSAFLL